MSTEDLDTLLLRRRRTVVVSGGDCRVTAEEPSLHVAEGLTALEAELADRGHVLTAALRRALGDLSASDLADAGKRLLTGIDALLGADRTHLTLFGRFPDGVPYRDAHSRFTTRIRAHLAALPDQPCMMCGAVVPGVSSLTACAHLVCRDCWRSWGEGCCEECCEWFGCPVCRERFTTGAPTDPCAPVQQPASGLPPTVLSVLHLAPSREAVAREELAALLARRTPLNPQDHDDLHLLLTEAAADCDTSWLPERIPLRESKALALDALLTAAGEPAVVEPLLRAHLDTATDVLRLLCVRSGADPDLLTPPARMRGGPRPLRRVLLSALDGLRFDTLAEDLGRHPRLWKRAAEALHPFEYVARHPRVALAFAALRGTTLREHDRLTEILLAEAAAHPEHIRLVGQRLRLTTWTGRVESALALYDVERAAGLLAARPGELLRRLRHLLNIAAFTAGAVPDAVVDALARALPRVEPGPLLGALGELRRARARGTTVAGKPRTGEEARRVFFPRGSVAKAYGMPDRRLPLPASMVDDLCALLEGEVLDRLATGGSAADATDRCDTAVLDAGLARLPLPTAERGSSAALVAVPRGSELEMPGTGSRVRLFLHWTQPRGLRVDLDLSVAVYDAEWRFLGLCDYTNLSYAGDGAVHSGDLTSAPAPHGATEYVDLDLPRLARAGARHLVTAVFSYTDTPFQELPDAFAGFMELDEGDRSDMAGERSTGASRRTRRRAGRGGAVPGAGSADYDPRSVRQRFDLDGDAKICLPMTVDLETRTARWTDVTLPGHGEMGDDVWRHHSRLGALARDLGHAFGDGARVTLWDLACWWAAARTRVGGRVLVRDGRALHGYRRRGGETVHAFATRVRERWTADDVDAGPHRASDPGLDPDERLFCALVHADLAGIPAEADGGLYRLFPGPADAAGLTPLAPGDLVAELRPRGV